MRGSNAGVTGSWLLYYAERFMYSYPQLTKGNESIEP